MKNFKDLYQKYFRIYPKELIPHFYFLIILILVNSILEFFAISSIIPIIKVLSDPEYVYLLKNKFTFFLNKEINLIIIILLTVFAFLIVLKNIYTIFFNKIRLNFTFQLRNKIGRFFLNHYLDLSNFDLKNKKSSEIIRNLETEIEVFCLSLTEQLVLFINNSVLIIGIFLLLLIVDYQSVLTVAIISTIFIYFYYKSYKSQIKFYGNLRQKTVSKKIKTIQEIFRTFKEIKIYSRENFFKRYYSNELLNYTKADRNFNFIIFSVRPLLEIFAIILFTLTMILSILIFEKANEIIIIFSIFAIATIRLLPYLSSALQTFTSIKYFIPTILILNQELDFFEKENNENKLLMKKKVFLTKFKNSIELNNVNFNYYKKNILRNIDLKINSGDIVGIYGPSGSGKSTLIDIIVGILKPSSGILKIDNHIVDYINKKYLIKSGYASQESFILEGSIKKNIIFGDESKNLNKKKLIKAIVHSQLNNFINSLKNKENTMLNELGGNVSGGQKQRISIARAIYNSSNLIILDEPTSSLDEETANFLIQKLKLLKKTIIIISHNKKSFKICNKIYRLKNQSLKKLK